MRGNQRGFTLVELLLATAVFSIALVAITAAIIQLFKAYQSGISIRKTQSTARVISEELTRQARASYAIAGDSAITNQSVCFFFPADKVQADGQDTADAARYYVNNEKLFKINKKVTFSSGNPTCDPALFTGGTETQISDDEITIKEFKGGSSTEQMMELVMKVGTTTTLAGEIENRTGDPANPDWQCLPGYEYCSMTTINKSVMARGGQ